MNSDEEFGDPAEFFADIDTSTLLRAQEKQQSPQHVIKTRPSHGQANLQPGQSSEDAIIVDSELEDEDAHEREARVLVPSSRRQEASGGSRTSFGRAGAGSDGPKSAGSGNMFAKNTARKLAEASSSQGAGTASGDVAPKAGPSAHRDRAATREMTPVVIDDDEFDDEFDDNIDESFMQQVEAAEQLLAGVSDDTGRQAGSSAWKSAGQSNSTSRNATASGAGGSNLRQMNLFREPVDEPATRSAYGRSTGPGGSSSHTGKTWEFAHRAATGGTLMRTDKGKGRQMDDWGGGGQDGEEELEEDWDNPGHAYVAPAPAAYGVGVNGTKDVAARAFVGPPPPMKLRINEDAAQTWIYPTNYEVRDYQYNIVQKALFNNVLVALPTGLGKTFIAAVVMLNFYRWYPKGKIIFVAPTRPLVHQQQRACHGICGLPWNVAVELTGERASHFRVEDYKEHRIFYMTPQTLMHDLEKGNLDARDVVCLVVDEAHRATGRYAYTVIVRQLMQRNPHFRLLALSATPGKNQDVVQAVIDNLHISEIEIRTDESLDIVKYVHRKKEEDVRVPRDAVIESVKEKWAALMATYLKPLYSFQLLRGDQKPENLAPYTIRNINNTAAHILKDKGHLRQVIYTGQKMAQAMGFLIDSSAKLFKDRVVELCSSGSTFKKSQQEIQDILTEIDQLRVNDSQYRHPKLEVLREVLEDHFNKDAISALQQADADGASGSDPVTSKTRAMVFCSSRETVEEIVANLNSINMEATRFVGQAGDRNGSRGMGQKEQRQAIQDFQNGKYRILVSTSIGEEGLDIGEIDLIVTYDAIGDSVRLTQRRGRTGRKRDGRVVYLVTEGRDERRREMAFKQHAHVLQTITNGHYELYDDVDRMVPAHIKPVVKKEKVPEVEFHPDMISHGKGARRNTGAAKKQPKNPKRNMPKDATGGFVKASALNGSGGRKVSAKAKAGILSSDTSDSETAKASKARAKARAKTRTSSQGDANTPKKDPRDGLSSGSDLGSEFEDRMHSTTLSKLVANIQADRDPFYSSQRPAKSGFTKASNLLVTSAGPTSRGPTSRSLPAKRALSSDSESDDEVQVLEREPKRRALSSLTKQQNRPIQSKAGQNEKVSSARSVSGPLPEASRSKWLAAPAKSTSQGLVRGKMHPAIAQLLASESGSGKIEPIEVINSSPEPEPEPELEPVRERPPRSKPAQPVASTSRALASPPPEMSDLGSSQPLAAVVSARSALPQGSQQSSVPDEEPLNWAYKRKSSGQVVADIDDDSDAPLSAQLGAKTSSSSLPVRRRRAAGSRALTCDNEDDDDSPLVTRKRSTDNAPRVLATNSSSPITAQKRVQARPLERAQTEPSRASKKQPKKKIRNSPTSRMLFQYEADRSTDEEVHGEKDEDDEGMNTDSDASDDRRHVGAFDATQAPKGYNQRAIYMQSLLTQGAPDEFQGGAARANPFPGVGGRFGLPDDKAKQRAMHNRAHRPVLLSSDAVQQEDDRYSVDSFVCDDEMVEYEEGFAGDGGSDL